MNVSKHYWNNPGDHQCCRHKYSKCSSIPPFPPTGNPVYNIWDSSYFSSPVNKQERNTEQKDLQHAVNTL